MATQSAPVPFIMNSTTTASTSSSSSSSFASSTTRTRLESLAESLDPRTLPTAAVTTSTTAATAMTIANSTVAPTTLTTIFTNNNNMSSPASYPRNYSYSDALDRFVSTTTTNMTTVQFTWNNKFDPYSSNSSTSSNEFIPTAPSTGGQDDNWTSLENFTSNSGSAAVLQSVWDVTSPKNSTTTSDITINSELAKSWLDNLAGAVKNATAESILSDSATFEPHFKQQLHHDEPLSLPLNFIMNDSYLGEHANCSGWNGTSDCYGGSGNDTALGGLDIVYNYWALLLIIFPVFTAFGNALVILSVKRERTLHNVTNYFIVSLAVADLLVAAIVMPFAVYFLFEGSWLLAPIFCDFYIGMDVVCSTSSICNLVAISIDRYIAVTQPIKYAKHKSNTRVWLTIAFVWIFSSLVGSPIMLGLNTPPVAPSSLAPFECAFNNKYFVLFSSLCSFYIPCSILVVLYYRIFKVIRERAKKACGGGSSTGGGAARKAAGNAKGGTVIENLAQTKRLAETALGGPSTIPPPKSNNVDDEKLTNTGSGSQDDGDDLEKEDMDGEDASPDSDDCHIIPNSGATGGFALGAVKEEDKNVPHRGGNAIEPNGNHDSGYAASNMGDALAPGHEVSPASPKLSLVVPPEQCKRNGLSLGGVESEPIALVSPGEASTGSNKKPASRFTICKVHKASRKKREKSSAKRERKATKTLAIVLGLFLICWLPFFTCNIMDALCTILNRDCSPGLVVFLTTTWLGYVNSCLNPVIYTIFNPEFRKAFKKIMGMAT